jgi:hypothetical protein
MDSLNGRTKPWVVCAANRSRVTGKIICGARHWDSIMRQQVKWPTEKSAGLPEEWRGAEQGFIDQFGNFLTREEAYKVALGNGQIARRCGGDNGTLFSENLY